MDCHQADVAEQTARRAARGRPPCPQRYLLGPAIRSTMARSAWELWPVHELLQPRRAGIWDRLMDAVSTAHGANRADDRYLDCACAPARGLYCRQQETTDGQVARWAHEQDSCGRRYN